MTDAARLARYEAALRRIVRLVLEQAEDEGLWGQAETAMEAYVQAGLRELHAMVEWEVLAAQ
jgi:hypothetical protein